MSADGGGAGPRPRAAIAALPVYVPGRPPRATPGATTYKLSSNENPFPPPPEVVAAVRASAERMNRYPDMGCTALYGALSMRLDVPTERLVAGTGSVAVLYHLLQAFCTEGDEVIYAWRSFEAYPIAVAVTGARAVPVRLSADGRHDLDAMAAAITERTRAVLVCSPNNPTGPALTHTEVDSFLDRVPPHVLVVLDEAYREFVRAADPLDGVALTRPRPNVVAMRTFAKAYGLAGLRVGYAVAPEPVAAAARACALPFGVSAPAQAAALAALEHEAVLMDRVDTIVRERVRLRERLAGQGWAVPEAEGNFVWLEAGERTGELAAAAEEAGVMVRPFGGDGVRVSVGEPTGNDLVVSVAEGFAPEAQG